GITQDGARTEKRRPVDRSRAQAWQALRVTLFDRTRACVGITARGIGGRRFGHGTPAFHRERASIAVQRSRRVALAGASLAKHFPTGDTRRQGQGALEVLARLAPLAQAHAQAAERQQQYGVVWMGFEPGFRAL